MLTRASLLSPANRRSEVHAEEHALFNMSRIQQTVVLDLRTSNILVSVLPTIDQLISKTFHLEGNPRIQNTNRYTENTLHWRKHRGGERSSMQQFTHPVHPKKLISLFVPASAAKREKYDRQRRKIQRAEKQAATKKTGYTGKQLSFQKINCIVKACPYQIACTARLSKLSFLAAVALP